MKRVKTERPLVRDASNLRQVKRAEDLEAMLAENRVLDLRAVLDLPAGRRVLWRLLTEQCGLYHQTFREGHADTSAFYEGKRSIALELKAEIGVANVDALDLMRQERAADDATEQAVRYALATNGDDEADDP
jgi:hypothetical protein